VRGSQSDADPVAYAVAYAYAYAVAYAYAYAHADAHAHADSYAYSYAYADADSYSYADADSYADAHAHAHAMHACDGYSYELLHVPRPSPKRTARAGDPDVRDLPRPGQQRERHAVGGHDCHCFGQQLRPRLPGGRHARQRHGQLRLCPVTRA
jgi:hypothetical protein